MIRTLGRWLLRLLAAMVALAVLLTLGSLAYNAATRPPATLTAPDGQDVVVDGVRVHYRHWTGHGHAVLLVHGFAESTVSWQPVAELLAKNHDVYAVDLPGYGYTQYSGRYRLADAEAAVDGVIRQLHLHHPLLVGHSLGAAVVGSVALHHPDHVGGVVFADGDALPFQGRRGDVTWLVRSPWFTSTYRLLTRTGSLNRPIIRRVCGNPCRGLTDELAAAWMRPMQQGDAEASLLVMAKQDMLALSPDEIRRIAVPRGIIWGSEDATGGGSLEATKQNLGHPATRIIAGAGHLSMLADPATFAADVDDLATSMHLG